MRFHYIWGMGIIIPKCLQAELLKELHRDHPGVSRMKATAKTHFWWPGLDKEIEELAQGCQSCQAVKPGPPVAPKHPWSWPTKSWQRIHIDFAGPFLGTSFLLTVDSHSKWPEIFEMKQTTYHLAYNSHSQTVICKVWSTTTDCL